MLELVKNLIEEKSPGAKPLLIVIRGSHAYGTNIETSDVDTSGVYIQDINDILGNGYKEQINDDKNDIVLYEIKRFLELCGNNNPNILELLNTPDDFVLYKDDTFQTVLDNRDKFLSKICANSFAGYARAQITKSKGQNKKQNWLLERVVRKTPLDFCYIHIDHKTTPLPKYLSDNNINQSNLGLSKVANANSLFAVFYDTSGKIGLRGIAFENSNELRLSSIEKGLEHLMLGYISYNMIGYTHHCKDWTSYQTWLDERNEARWVDVKTHGQKIDGKNMMHCRRLMDMSREIAEGKGVNVHRENAEFLISIRKGEIDLGTLITHVESEIDEIFKLFNESNLPNSVDMTFINDLLVTIRRKNYNL